LWRVRPVIVAQPVGGPKRGIAVQDFLNNMSHPEQIKGLWWTGAGLIAMALYLLWLWYFFGVVAQWCKRGVEQGLGVEINDFNEGRWDQTEQSARRTPWYVGLLLALLQIPIFVIGVLGPFAVIMTIWFLLAKRFW
jgi:hypothetical protein